MHKAISPLIAAVILVFIVLLLSIFISGFFASIFTSRYSQASTMEVCSSASMDVFNIYCVQTSYKDPDLIAYWSFNSVNASNYTSDSSGNGNDGKVTNATIITGKYDNALQFDGSNDYVNAGNNSVLNITDGITLEAWIKGSGVNFSAVQRTTGAYDKYGPQLQVVGSKIYYIWLGREGGIGTNYQIWTGEMNIDGTNFTATKRTTDGLDKYGPRLQVVGSKIYYAWLAYNNSNSQREIWTGEMNIDGTNFTATKRREYNRYIDGLYFQVVGSKIYYVWYESDGTTYQIWTAEMNTDGTGWSATQRTNTSSYDSYQVQMQVVGSKIYYVWSKYDSDWKMQIWTAEMNTDGTNWTATQRTTSAYDKNEPQLQVVGSKIYYAWQQSDGSGYYQIWTAEMNTDGTNWTATQRTSNSYQNEHVQLQVVGSKIYYAWVANGGLWTAEMNTDGTNWTATQRTGSTYPHFQVVGSKIYYVWYKLDGSYNQIWTGELNSNIINKGDFYGIGISNNTVKGFINAGTDELKYNANAINYANGATVESTIDTSAWNFIALTYNKSKLKLYINGVLVNETIFSYSINTNPFDLIIGDDFNGTIDDVRIYNKSLSASEILQHYNNQYNTGNSNYVLKLSVLNTGSTTLKNITVFSRIGTNTWTNVTPITLKPGESALISTSVGSGELSQLRVSTSNCPIYIEKTNETVSVAKCG